MNPFFAPAKVNPLGIYPGPTYNYYDIAGHDKFEEKKIPADVYIGKVALSGEIHLGQYMVSSVQICVDCQMYFDPSNKEVAKYYPPHI